MPEKFSIIAPTRNRGYTLSQVVHSWYAQADVDEVVFVDDAGSDDTQDIVCAMRERHAGIRSIYLRNPQRRGAAYSRMQGVKACSNDVVLFCDDDDFLGAGYAQTCLRKMLEKNAAIVSGRHFYRLPGEAITQAVRRFGTGLIEQQPFDTLRFRVNTDARFEGDLEMPFTHGIFMTRRSLLLGYGLDAFYSKGNGFREESDVQIRAFLDGHRIVVTNEAHAVHLHPSEVRSGGQRVGRLQRYFWTVYYTRYFFRKYFDRAREKLRIPYPQPAAMLLYALLEGYVFFVRPFVILPGRLLAKWRR